MSFHNFPATKYDGPIPDVPENGIYVLQPVVPQDGENGRDGFSIEYRWDQWYVIRTSSRTGLKQELVADSDWRTAYIACLKHADGRWLGGS